MIIIWAVSLNQNELTLHLTDVDWGWCDDLWWLVWCLGLGSFFICFGSCFEPFEPLEPFSGSRKARCSSRPWASMAVRPRRPWRRGQASRPCGSPRHATTCDDMRRHATTCDDMRRHASLPGHFWQCRCSGSFALWLSLKAVNVVLRLGFCMSKQTPLSSCLREWFVDTIRIRLAVQATSKRLQGHILCWYSDVQNVFKKWALRPLRPLRPLRRVQCANHGTCLTESAEWFTLQHFFSLSLYIHLRILRVVKLEVNPTSIDGIAKEGWTCGKCVDSEFADELSNAGLNESRQPQSHGQRWSKCSATNKRKEAGIRVTAEPKQKRTWAILQ